MEPTTLVFVRASVLPPSPPHIDDLDEEPTTREIRVVPWHDGPGFVDELDAPFELRAAREGRGGDTAREGRGGDTAREGRGGDTASPSRRE